MERNVALALAVLTFWVGITLWRASRRGHSPTATAPAAITESPQVDTTASDGGTGGGAQKPITVGELSAWMRDHPGELTPSALVRAAIAEHGVSERTAWRAWEQAKPASEPAPGPLGRLFGAARGDARGGAR